MSDCGINNKRNREGSMVLKPIECPTCGTLDVVKYGKTDTGKQRLLCQNPKCHAQTFVSENAHKGRLPQTKGQIIAMSLNGSGIRDIARVLEISPSTVINEIKKNSKARAGQ
jgi:transposase-like protein